MANIINDLSNTIRFLSVDAVEAANAGHPGMPMGCADIAAVLWAKHMRFSGKEPNWAGRDRFVLSAGHGSMLLYSALHLFGYDLPLEELKNFRQMGSKTPGHPENFLTPGVEVSTGPLGQGFANGLGLALSIKMLQSRFNHQLFDSKVYGIVSDGDLMEGVASEAASLAGHLALGNLIYVYDDNDISIGGSTDICFSEDVEERFESYGWHVLEIDGHDHEEIDRALSLAKEEERRPSLIIAKTTIGYGSPNKAGSAGVHGSPLGSDETLAAKKKMDWPTDKVFFIPEQVSEYCQQIISACEESRESWEESFSSWTQENPKLQDKYFSQMKRELPSNLAAELLSVVKDDDNEATRNLSGKVIQKIAELCPYFVGGSADLEPSNKTLIKSDGDLASDNFLNRNIRFGVREHAMGSLVNGLAYEKCWIPFSATFLVFSDYMRPAIRLAALSKIQSLFIFTHDSFYVGEDGPTHQPIEHIDALRCIPNLKVYRPADALEVAYSYAAALEDKNAPSTLLFTRQGLPALDRSSELEFEQFQKGAYLVQGEPDAELTLVATGSEVSLACEVAAKRGNCRVVSVPCLESFLEQDAKTRNAIIPSDAKVVTIEAGVTRCWRNLFGGKSLAIGIDHFGASARAEELAEKFGFTAETVSEKIDSWLSE